MIHFVRIMIHSRGIDHSNHAQLAIVEERAVHPDRVGIVDCQSEYHILSFYSY